MNKKLLAHTAILGANLIYGINYSIAKPIMPNFVSPYGLAFMRVFGALLLFWLFGFGVKERINKPDLIRLFFSGLFGVAVNQLLFLNGLNHTTPIDASIIMVSNPILVLVAASIILKEKITLIKAIGIFIGAAGASFLILQGGKFNFSNEHFLGNVQVFLNAASYGIYLVIVKPLMAKYHPFTVMKWAFLFGAFIVLPAGYQSFTAITWETMPTKIILSVGYVILGTTFFAYLLNIFAMKQVSPTTVSIYIYLQPAIASVTAIFLQQDQLTLVKVVATLAIFIGVYLVSQPKIVVEKIRNLVSYKK